MILDPTTVFWESLGRHMLAPEEQTNDIEKDAARALTKAYPHILSDRERLVQMLQRARDPRAKDMTLKKWAKSAVSCDAVRAMAGDFPIETLVALTQSNSTKALVARRKNAALAYAKELQDTGDNQQALQLLQEAGNSKEAGQLIVEALCAQDNMPQLLKMLLTGGTLSVEDVPVPACYALATLLVTRIETSRAPSKKAQKDLKKKLSIARQLMQSIPRDSEHLDAIEVLTARLLIHEGKKDAARSLLFGLEISGSDAASSLLATLQSDASSPDELIAKERAKTPTLLEGVARKLRVISPVEEPAPKPAPKKKKEKKKPQETPAAAASPTQEQEPKPATEVTLSPYQEAMLWLASETSDEQKHYGIQLLWQQAANGSTEAFSALTGQCLYMGRFSAIALLGLVLGPEQHAHLVVACEHANGSDNAKAQFIAGTLALPQYNYGAALLHFQKTYELCTQSNDPYVQELLAPTVHNIANINGLAMQQDFTS